MNRNGELLGYVEIEWILLMVGTVLECRCGLY